MNRSAPAAALAVFVCALVAGSEACSSSSGPTTSPSEAGADATPEGGGREGGTRRDSGSAETSAADTGPSSCAPNATEKCSCKTAGAVGIRQCIPDGSGWRACSCQSYGVEFAVSPTGSDSAKGTLADPFRTLGRAESAVRTLVGDGGSPPSGGVVVWVRGGSYEMTSSFTITAADSGSSSARVVYSGYPGESANLVGGKSLPPSSFAPVTSASPIWSRLDPSAQGKVVVASLPALGVTDYGTLLERGFCNFGNGAALELAIDGVAMPLARWPDPPQDTPPQSDTGTMLTVYGSGISPDVTGAYVKTGTADGVSQYARSGLVGGKQYNLHRWTSGSNTAWFLTTTPTGYPSNTDPWFYLYAPDLGSMTPNNGASGSPGFQDPAGYDHGFSLVTTALSSTVFGYANARPSRWSQAADAWVHGMFQYDWADCHEAVSAIDTGAQTITLASTPGYGIAVGQPWYAENLVEEITQPGEWYLDRSNGNLYLWPPASGLAGATIVVSMLTTPIVSIQGAHDVTLQDLTLESGRADLIDVSGATDVTLLGLTLRNAGASAASIEGTNVGVSYAHVYGTGNGGISLAGGDRPSLTPGKNFVEDSNLHDFGRWQWMYEPGISLNDVGQRANNNRIHDSPHAAILYGGNDHLIEKNDIYDACQYTADAGAIYSGRDWGARGNVIQYNYLHAITSFLSTDVHAIYLDDCLSGILVQGNVVDGAGGFGILHGGGRDDILKENVLARCGAAALSADARCLTWLPSGTPNHTPGDSWDLLGKLEADKYQEDPWATTFPTCAAIPDDWNTLIAPDSGWLLPQGTAFTNNLGYANHAWIAQEDMFAIPAYAAVSGNVPDAGDPFVNEEAGSPALTDAAVAAQPGLASIPFASIGIQP